MNDNDYFKIKKRNDKEDSLIINDDLFDQKGLDSDDDQIILNEERDEECSFFSNKSEDELNKLNIISDNIKITKDNNVQNEKNENIGVEKIINIKNGTQEIKNLEKEKKDNIFLAINDIEIKEEGKKTDDNNQKLEEKKDNTENIFEQINNNINVINSQKVENKISENYNSSKNYFSKKVIYKKNKVNRDNNENKFNNNFSNKKAPKIERTKTNEKNNKKIITEKKQKSKKSYINKMREKKNMKINYENHSKLWKNSSRNEEETKSYLTNEKNNVLSKSAISYDKYGNKTVIKKRDYVDNLNKIKIDKKMNRSFDKNFTKKNVNNLSNNNSSKNNSYCQCNQNSPKITHKRINFTNIKKDKKNNYNVDKSNVLITKNSTKNSLKEKENNADNLKKILMNKINKQINEVINKKGKLFFNENNKLFFLGFCDILFELGFLHIKETEIKDISKIKNHINDLYTQPFTNRTLLSENFLFNEQKLLICAWKTILNNFILIKEFDSLPEESEEISLDDCKLFLFIITGLFIGFNNKCLNENNKIKTERNLLKNKSLSNFRKKNNNKDIISGDKLNQSYNKNSKSKSKSKYHFRKKSENKNIMDSNNTSNYSNSTNNDNILKNILDNRKKSDYNYKSILKVKNFFTYFSELRKLFNLYKKELKNINTKKEVEKDLTFYPKTNKSNKIYLNKISPKMDFFQRNELLKKRNEKKIIILQKERSQKMLKECTFEPCKNNKNKNSKKMIHINPKEFTNRLYHSCQNSKNLKSGSLNINPNSTCKQGEKIISEKRIKEMYHFIPNTNKKFNREMFDKSPLDQDELLNKRIKDLRDANLARIIYNYEKNTREILSNDLKKDKNLLLNEILLEDKSGMKLDMEKKTNKDTFDNFQNFNFYDFPNLDNYLYQNKMAEPLFSVEIKIKKNIKTIDVYQDDVPEKLAYDFCVENMLGKGSYEKIVNIIKDKLDEIYNGNNNENGETSTNNDINNNYINNENNNSRNLDNELEINDNKENINKKFNNGSEEIININLNDNENINNEKDVNINEKNNYKDQDMDDISNSNEIDKNSEEIKKEINEGKINHFNIEKKFKKKDFEEEEKNITNEDN